MTKSLSNTITLILASLGSLVALALTYDHFHPHTLPCSVHGHGCETTLTSSYAQIGPVPTAVFGLGMYLLFILLCLQRRKLLISDRNQEEARARAYAGAVAAASTDLPGGPADNTVTDHQTPLKLQIKRLDMTTWLLALAGFGISWWLQYTAIWVLLSFCPYCFTSALLATCIFLLASRDYLLDGRVLTGEQKLLGAVLSFVLVMLGFLFVPQALEIINHPPTGTDNGTTRSLRVRDVVVRNDMHVMGDPRAKFLIVEFADYQCPHCAEASKAVPELLKKRPDVRFAYRNYPLLYPNVKFPHSDEASFAAEAAALQGKFWQMHDLLFQLQDEIKAPGFNAEQFNEYADRLGLNVDKFKADMQSAKVHDRVASDHSDGDQANVESTPSFYIITPDKTTSLVGKENLEKYLSNPNDPVWK